MAYMKSKHQDDSDKSAKMFTKQYAYAKLKNSQRFSFPPKKPISVNSDPDQLTLSQDKWIS